jgi:hypothetical protein
MGDRVSVRFADKNGDVTPCVYMHWGGSSYRQLLERTRERCESMGRDGPRDAAETLAVFAGVCAECREKPSIVADEKQCDLSDHGLWEVELPGWVATHVTGSTGEGDEPFTVPAPKAAKGGA